MSEELTWTLELERKIGHFFANARYHHIHYTEEDLAYIEKIKNSDDYYRLMVCCKYAARKTEDKYQKFYNARIIVFWLGTVLNDPSITPGVERFVLARMKLKEYYNQERKNLNKKKKSNGKKKSLGYYDLTLHNFFIERWLETCH